MMKLWILLVSLTLGSVVLADAPKPAAPAAAQRIEIAVTRNGFEPGDIKVAAKKPVTLVFTRKTEQTCTKTVVIAVDDTKKIEKPLPLNEAVEVAVTFPKAGKLTYACSMNMNKGTIVVQ